MLWLAEIANFISILALVLSLAIPCLNFLKFNFANINSLINLAFTLVFWSLSAILLLLGSAFLLDDFSLEYVAQNSSTSLNWYYKISGVWGGHEGSLLFWIYTLLLVTFGFTHLHKKLSSKFKAQVQTSVSFVASGFLAYVIFLGNPFARNLPFIPQEGADLNPMLQDLGLIFHPPLLYLGYAGLVLNFAIASYILLQNKTNSKPHLQILQNSLRFSWIFLTLGILLGSFWAYYELGWGGWWFWDQVENSSLIPWLFLTFSLHSGKVAIKTQRLVKTHFSVLVLAFITSLLGNFLVRSGILSSVHSFASSPTKGKFILFLIFIIASWAIFLLITNLKPSKHKNLNGAYGKKILTPTNILFFALGIMAILAFSTALGTWYPILLQALNLGDISVGAPYFNSFFVPLVLLLAFLLGLAFFITKFKNLTKNFGKTPVYLAIFLLSASGFFLQFIWLDNFNILLATSLSLVVWILVVLLLEVLKNFPIKKYGIKLLAKHLAHLGFALSILGASVSTLAANTQDLAIKIGEEVQVNGHSFLLLRIEEKKFQNYYAQIAHIEISQLKHKNKQTSIILYPEKRLYFSSPMPMFETGIDSNIWRDIYLAIGEKISPNILALRIDYKPMIRFLWLGAIFMALGGIFAMIFKEPVLKSP